VKKHFLIILFFALAVTSARAQSAVATFDNPSCSGNGVRTYQDIDFSLSPWDCENPALSGQTGTSISWFQRITTGQFRFISPQVLVSLSAATSAGSGRLTISTDAGESFSHSITTMFQTFQTGFSKPASVVTVRYPGGWTIQLDNIMYQTVSAPPPVGTLNASASLTWDDGTPVSGSLTLAQLKGSTTPGALGTFPISSTGTVSGIIKIDLSQPDPLTFQVILVGPALTSTGPQAVFQVIKAMFPSPATGINAKIVLWKNTTTIKSFEIGLTP
jgi:hypothetical protein